MSTHQPTPAQRAADRALGEAIRARHAAYAGAEVGGIVVDWIVAVSVVLPDMRSLYDYAAPEGVALHSALGLLEVTHDRLKAIGLPTVVRFEEGDGEGDGP